jgi:hypothetical protein
MQCTGYSPGSKSGDWLCIGIRLQIHWRRRLQYTSRGNCQPLTRTSAVILLWAAERSSIFTGTGHNAALQRHRFSRPAHAPTSVSSV